MAKGIPKVTSNVITPNIKMSNSTIPSLLDCVDEPEVGNEEVNEFDKFMCKLKGETKRHFVALLEQLGEANDVIESQEESLVELRGHSHDYADEIAELS